MPGYVRYGVVPLTVLSVIAACGGSDFSGATSADAGTTDDATSQPPGNDAAPADDAGAQADTNAPDDATPPPVEAGDCAALPDESIGAFVSPTGTATTGCTSSSPCATIAQAQAWGATNGHYMIYVDRGTYTEQVTLAKGQTIQGGWELKAGHWQRICDASRATATTIQAPAGANVTVIAKDLGGTATMDTLQITGRATPAAAGESMYGVMATGASTTLDLAGVTVVTPKAGDGTSGTNGTTPAQTQAGCPTTGSGTTPASGPAGAGATAGTYSANGYTPAAATAGTAGGTGGNGTTASAGTCETLASPCYFCANGVSSCANTMASTICGDAGQAGCGGGGGGQGTPGTSGGSSIGVFVWDAKVSVTESSLSSGDGGKGGDGGSGAAGGAPGAGILGGNATCASGCTAQCTATTLRIFTGLGGNATGGAAGSAGGDGGGGAGGDSYAYYTNTQANVTVTTSTLHHGNAGAPGARGAPAAAAGNAGEHN